MNRLLAGEEFRVPKRKQPAPTFSGFPLAETPKVLRD
jgi:hypothetical protein